MEKSDQYPSLSSRRSRSLLASSDESELFCDFCLEDGNHFEAEGYCVDCTRHLCGECFKYHRRHNPWRYHHLLDKQQMPHTKPNKVYKDECTEKCKAHEDEIVKYFCEDHREFGCTLCVTLAHRTCSVDYIPNLSEQLFQNVEYKRFKNTLESLSEKVNSIHEEATQNLVNAKIHADKALSKLKELRKQIDEIVDNLEKSISEELSKMANEDNKKIEELLKECNKLSEKFKELKHDMHAKESKNQKCRLFADMKRSEKTIHKLAEDIHRLEKDNVCRRTDFIPSKSVASFINDNSHNFGSFVSLHQTIHGRAKGPIANACCISDIAVLSGERIAVVDHSEINIIDTRHDEVEMSGSLYGDPGGITAVSYNEIAITLGGNDIVIFNVTDRLKLNKTIQNADLAHSIVYTNNMFLGFTLYTPHNVRTVNMKGDVVKTFSTEINGDELFEDPDYVAVNPDHTAIYVSDLGKETVTCLTFEGEVKAQYKQRGGWFPRGVAVSREGTVYVCDSSYNNIHILTSDLQEIGVINGVEYGISEPRGLAYSDREQKLYVGMDYSDAIVVLNVNA